MIFKYPEEFIVPIRTFRLKDEINLLQTTSNVESKNIVEERIANDIMQIKREYERDKSMWRCFDRYYSENETGMLRSYYNKK